MDTIAPPLRHRTHLALLHEPPDRAVQGTHNGKKSFPLQLQAETMEVEGASSGWNLGRGGSGGIYSGWCHRPYLVNFGMNEPHWLQPRAIYMSEPASQA